MATLTLEQQGNEHLPNVGHVSLSDMMQAQYVWNLVTTGWYKLIFFTMLGWLVASVYFVVSPPIYQSKAQLYVMMKDSSLATRGETSSSKGGTSVSDDLLATQMQIIQSSLIWSKVIERGEPPIKELPSLQKAAGGSNPVNYLIDNLKVTRGGEGQARDAHILTISLQHSSREDCKIILGALLTEYDSYLKDKFQDVNKDAAVLISQARQELEDELTAAETAYREFRENAPILLDGSDLSTNVYRMRYESIQEELSQMSLKIGSAQTRLKVVKAALDKQEREGAPLFDRLALIDEANATRIAVMLTVQSEKEAVNPERAAIVGNEYGALFELMLREKTMSKQFGLGPNHPEIMSLREQIDAGKSFLGEKQAKLEGSGELGFQIGPEQVLNAYVKLLENDLDSLHERKIQLEAQAKIEEEGAKQMVKYEMDGTALAKQIERQQQLYDTVVDRLRDINIAQEYGGVVNDVISPPELGGMVWPQLAKCLLLGTFFGLTIGGISTVVSEVRDRSFRSPEQVKEALGVPLLTHLPKLDPSKDATLTALIKETHSAVHPSIYVHHLPKSINAESFRALRTSVYFKRSPNQNLFSVTSANQGDGKSTTLANLAASIAQSGRRVLVVDCDMRRPSIHHLFGLTNDVGTADVIGSDREPWDVIKETEIENLSVLTSGPLPQNPAELLSSNKFREVLSLFRERYDFVLVDSPPVLAVTDPAIVATAVDAALFLVNVGKDKRPEAMHAKEILASVGAKILGVMVSGGNAEAGSRYSGGYGRYGYEYGAMGSNKSYYVESNSEDSRSRS